MHRPGHPTLFIISTIACAVIITAAGAATARTWHVPAEVATIAAALDSASAGDQVVLACGTYHEHDLMLKGGVAVRSELGVATCVTIDADQQGRVFTAENLTQSASVQGVTMTGGFVPGVTGLGGGVFCENAVLTLLGCTITGNVAGYRGGGVYAHASDLTLYVSGVTDNEGGAGGAGGMYAYATSGEIFSSRIMNNRADDGAGLYLYESSIAVNFCEILNNEGQYFGGGVFCLGGIDNPIVHCTIAGNRADIGAGIMFGAGSVSTVEMCVVAFNHGSGGIDVNDTGTDITVRCSDVHGNDGGGYTGYIGDQTGVAGNIDADPLFCDLAGGDVGLAGESPCLPLNNDCLVQMGAQGQGCTVTPVQDTPAETPRLAQNAPNPFNPMTTIAFDLPEAMAIDLSIFDLGGHRVTVLAHGETAAGHHAVTWQGQDDRGRALASGTYISRLRAGDHAESRVMQLVR